VLAAFCAWSNSRNTVGLPLAAAGGWSDVRTATLRMDDRRQQMSATFGGDGVTIRSAGLILVLGDPVAGRGGSHWVIPPVRPHGTVDRVVYNAGAWREWFSDGPMGLEQGFSFARRPGHGTAPLTVSLRLRGNATATAAGGAILFAGPRGARLRYAGLVVRDVRGRRLPARLAVARHRLIIQIDDRGATYPVRIDPFIQQAKLTDASSPEFGALGQSLALVGDTAVAGETASGDPDNGPTQAEVFVAPSGGWGAGASLVARLAAGTPTDSFGASVAISADQATIVVGAPTTNSSEGKVYIFQRPAGGWSGTLSPTAALDVSGAGGAADDRLGKSVAISPDGTIIAAGRPGANSSHGAVDVFKRPVSGWASTATPTATLTDFGGQANDSLGSAVGTSGNTIVAGAPGANFFTGKALVYAEPGSGWTSAISGETLFAGGGQSGDGFGSAVAIDSGSNTIAIGAPNRASGAGGVYAYSRPGPTWVTASQNALLTASSGGAVPNLGTSVSIDGSAILAGAPNASVNNQPGQGSAYVFAMPAGGWANAGPSAELIASDGAANNQLGSTVALSDGTALVGDPNGPPSGLTPFSGSVYAFGSIPSTSAALTPGSPNGRNGWYTTAVNVTVAATDLDSPVAATRCELDPAAPPAVFGSLAPSCPFAGAGGAVRADGRHVLYMASINQAANAEPITSVSLAIDRTRPRMSCAGTPQFALRGKGGLVSATVSDAVSGAAAPAVFVRVHPNVFGRGSVVLRGADNAGNSSTIRCPYVVTAPLLKPSPTMTWNFRANHRFTTVLSLLLAAVPNRADVHVLCSGGGCPFRSHTSQPVVKCRGKGRGRRCSTHAPGTHTVSLTNLFAHRQLDTGTRVTVEVAQANRIGKAFEFKMRASRQPAVTVGCLAPGSSRPGRGC
jgi:hypothetical protein